MKLILILAWRNIWRNWRRSLLTILAIFFAVFLSVIMRGFQKGTYKSNIELATSIFSGDIQVQKEGFQDNPSLRKSFKYDDDFVKKIEETPHLKGYAPRIYSFGLIGFGDNSTGAAIFGIDPEHESDVSTLAERIEKGTFLKPENKYDLIIGYKLIKNINAKIGDTVIVLSNAYDGSMGNLKFRIAGISKMGMGDFDRSSVFMNLDAAKELLYMGKKVNVIAVAADDIENIQPVKADLQNDFAGTDLEVLDWKEIMPEFNQTIEFDNVTGIIFLAILILVVAFGILNTVLMSVTERFREFGVMLAFGTKQSTLLMTVFFETLFLTIIGLLAGTIIGALVNYYFSLNPIYFGGDTAEIMAEFGFEPKMVSIVTPGILLNNALVIMITALVVFIYPGYRVFKLEALKGIRYT